jgi:FMN phosphatase YigB (HAD superfamily)
MMLRAILFDLDDTLLGNDMNTFLPHYFDLCGQFAARHMPPEAFMQKLIMASRAMVQNVDPTVTNEEAFWTNFDELLDQDASIIAAEFDSFYLNEFEQLSAITDPTPIAAELIDWCFQYDLQIVIATNPMFPRRAVEARLSWAGIPVTNYEYALVTTMENMHATKPHTEYYNEILDRIGCRPHEALMVGDDCKNDIIPAIALGLFTYWIQLPGTELPPDLAPTAQGSLAELRDRIEQGWLDELGTAVPG